MFQITEVFDSLLTVKVKVLRTSLSNRIVDFELVEQSEDTSFDITASVQHTNPKELSFLPTGYNIGSYRTIYTTFPLRMASSIPVEVGSAPVDGGSTDVLVGEGVAADKVHYNGVVYEVISINDRQDSGFTKAIMVAGTQ